MSDPSSIEQQLVAWERLLLRSEVRRSAQVSRLLADDFVEFGSSGRIFSKPEIISSLQTEPSVELVASEFAVRRLAADVALLTYRVQRMADPPAISLRSSLWRKHGEHWQMVFHQGTPVPK
jgi:hypothetical protein